MNPSKTWGLHKRQTNMTYDTHVCKHPQKPQGLRSRNSTGNTLRRFICCTRLCSEPIGRYIDPGWGMLVNYWVCDLDAVRWHHHCGSGAKRSDALHWKSPSGQDSETSALLVVSSNLPASKSDMMRWLTERRPLALSHWTVAMCHVFPYLRQGRWVFIWICPLVCLFVFSQRIIHVSWWSKSPMFPGLIFMNMYNLV